jgi:hypothetical protein
MPKKQQTYRIPLHEAWHQFASRPLKERLRSAQTLPNPKAPDIRTMDQDDQMRVALEHIAKMAKHYSNKTDPVFEMQRELCHKLIIGKLEAWGYRTQPDIRNEIEQIPRYMFRGKIDWHKCTVTNGAQKYEGIEVARAHISGATHKSSRDTALLIAQERENVIGHSGPGKIGRPRIDGPLRAIVRSLAKLGQLTGKTRKEQETIIRQSAQEQHPSLFPKETVPSRAKILEALKAEGVSLDQTLV